MSMPEIQSHRERQERASRAYELSRRPIRRLAGTGQHRRQTAGSGQHDGPAPDSASCRENPADQAQPVPSPSPSAGSRAAERFSWSSFFFWTAFLALLVLQSVMVYKGFQQKQAREQEAVEAQAQHDALEQHIQELEDAAPVTVELRYLVPNQEDITEQVPYGTSVTLHEPVELEGYTFLCWTGSDGEPERRETFTLYEDTVLTAKYALPLETEEHLTYLSADDDGVVDVDAPVTIREFVKILYRLLNIDLVGSGSFFDVSEKDSCYKAAATLKDLGILEGNELYPNEVLRFQEMLVLLERFYPETKETFDFPGLDPDSEAYAVYCTAASYGWIDPGEETDPFSKVTRGQLAHVVNRVLGRSTAHPPESAVGMILDVGPAHPYYADIAEAVIRHSYTRQDSVEVWTGSLPLPAHEPGMFFAGVRLHCIGEDGRPFRSTTVDGRTYNMNGELTSGDAELDHALWAILKDNVDPAVMTGEEMLYQLYDWICRNFSPAEDTLYPPGAEGWAVKEAKRILKAGEASSYGYAALFYELAYMVGYQPVLYSGSIYGTQTCFESEEGERIEAHAGHTPHAWVEIKFDGIWFIYDPAGESQVDSYRMYYKRNEPVRWQRGYRSDVF